MENSKAAASKKTPASRPKKKSLEPAKAKPKKATRTRRASKPTAPTQEEIALKAYFISEERQKKGIPGSHEDDWLEAERQLKAGR